MPQSFSPFIIALDGPAASGKGTLAKRISKHYSLPHLDTGLTYRFVAYQMQQHHLPLNDEQAAINLADKIDFKKMDKKILAQDFIGIAASQISTMPKLREILVQKQREFAQSGQGAVLDGRDIGTVVYPNAQVKLYIIADAEVRAKRRWQEMSQNGARVTYDEILQDLKARDDRDQNRKSSPLKPAQDAHLLDTTKLGIEEAFHQACRFIDTVKSHK